MKELLAQQKQQEVLSKISNAHPDYVDIIKESAFAEWVNLRQLEQSCCNELTDMTLTLLMNYFLAGKKERILLVKLRK